MKVNKQMSAFTENFPLWLEAVPH